MSLIRAWKFQFTEESYHSENVILSRGVNSLNAISQELPGGAYTTFRTFEQGKVFRLEEHFSRLEETAELHRVPIRLNRHLLRQVLGCLLLQFPEPDMRVRLTLDLEKERGAIYLTMESLKLPSQEAYREGVCVVTRYLHRTNPRAKLTHFISTAEEMRKGIISEQVNEVVMLQEDGSVLEGLTSNVFMVKNAELWTAETGVLHGLTRALVLEEAVFLKIPVHLERFHLAELNSFDEMFITSASRAVLPVTCVDGHSVGNGKPGRITRMLLEHYNQRIHAELETLSCKG